MIPLASSIPIIDKTALLLSIIDWASLNKAVMSPSFDV